MPLIPVTTYYLEMLDPRDLRAFGTAVDRLLGAPSEAAGLGVRARLRVTDDFLGDRHLIQWVDLLQELG